MEKLLSRLFLRVGTSLGTSVFCAALLGSIYALCPSLFCCKLCKKLGAHVTSNAMASKRVMLKSGAVNGSETRVIANRDLSNDCRYPK